ncbi:MULTISPECIES: tail fiber domain-containing protein [unclassified Pseudomonas]|uniref:tail fiber domain-containing protein n=1 Tax=unclassified Pseudomonas TaxID=196821 RepID=UPI001B32B489|nr:tail fiber domain-containing protein [Pseudomonas sp. P116]
MGDAFIGQDGLSYEIGNIASATVMSIVPAYKGPTAIGAPYAIMPVQGYPKALADAFSDINRQWGVKLSALGTTGNYEILPISKGGTGTSNLSTDAVPEGPTNRYFSGSRVLASLLDGLSTASAAVIVAGDNVLSALGKLQAQITGRALKGNNNDITGLLATAYVRTSGTTNVAQGQGLYQLWNTGAGGLVGSGDWVCNQGGGTGGFSWRSVNLNNTATGPTMTYTYAGNLNVPGTVSQGSDRRLKTNDVEILDGLDRILQIRPVEFDRRDFLDSTEYPHHEVGVIAQELFEITPLLVTPAKPDIEEDIWRVNYTGLIPYLVSAIKTLKAELDELKANAQ